MLDARDRRSMSVVGRIALLALLAVSATGAWATAQVGVPVVPDSDGDGIDDVLEEVLDTNSLGADSDGDGWNDGIELARRSDPLVAANVPGGVIGQLAVGLWSRASRTTGYVRSYSFIYLPSGYPASGLELELVILRPDLTLLVLDESYLASPQARRQIDFLPVPNDAEALLMVMGANLPDAVIRAQGYMSAAVVAWYGAASAPEAAARDRDAIDGLWLQLAPGTPILYRRPISTPGAGATDATAIYQPIDPSQEPPPDWTPGQICRQSGADVGYENGLVIWRVSSGSCADGWDAHCSPSECAATVGDEYTTVDPVGLIGG